MATTIVENAATLAPALLLVWMISRPFTISRAEAKSLQTVYGIFQANLIAVWFAGLSSLASMVLVAGPP